MNILESKLATQFTRKVATSLDDLGFKEHLWGAKVELANELHYVLEPVPNILYDYLI